MNRNSKLEMNVFGTSLTLRSEMDPDLAKKIVELAEKKIRQVSGQKSADTPEKVFLLALLSLAEDYFTARKRVAEYQDRLRAVTSEIKFPQDIEMQGAIFSES